MGSTLLMNKQKYCMLLLAAAAVPITTLFLKKRNKRSKRKVWSRKWLLRRHEGRGVLHMLENELRVEDPDAYKTFIRMYENCFDELLELVKKDITKEDTNMREAISAKHRLQLTLRYLAGGETYRSLMFATRIHESTISQIIPTVCKAIYKNLKDIYLKIPQTPNEWEKVAEEFESQWNFPLCIGALDGKHVNFQPPHSAGSYYYNYKGQHSIVLLAVCDAKYQFLYVDVGVNGRNSDGGVFRESDLKKAMDNGSLNFPKNKCLQGGCGTALPYTLVADDAFPLSQRIMKPYSNRGLTVEKRIFNYRLSRARRCIENAFGILANRFRILLHTINLCPSKVEDIVLACCTLHNFLIQKNGYNYVNNNINVNINMKSLMQPQGGNRCTEDALFIRNKLCEYVNGVGSVPWQNIYCLNADI